MTYKPSFRRMPGLPCHEAFATQPNSPLACAPKGLVFQSLTCSVPINTTLPLENRVCEETGQNRQIMSCLYDHRCRILPPNSSDRSFSDAATVLEAAGMRRISSIWRPGSRNRVWALTAAWNLGISLLSRCLAATRQTRQTMKQARFQWVGCGSANSLAFTCNTCLGQPSRVRRTSSIWRPTSRLANRPRSRSRWRSVCSLIASRSAPAIC